MTDIKYICRRCHYTSKRCYNLKLHLSSKKNCKPIYCNKSRSIQLHELGGPIKQAILDKQHTDINNTICKYCNKQFKTATSRYRHQNNYCKKKQLCNVIENIDLGDENISADKKLIMELTQKVNTLMNQMFNESDNYDINSNNSNNNNANNNILNDTSTNILDQSTNKSISNNINNSTNHVQINQFGQEDITYITPKRFKEILSNPYTSVPELINEIHFNNQQPQNHNLRIPNKKQPLVEYFKNNRWNMCNQYKFLCKFYRSVRKLLDEAFSKYRELLDKEIINAYEEYKRNADGDLFTFKSQIGEIKATIISGTRKGGSGNHKPTFKPITDDKLSEFQLKMEHNEQQLNNKLLITNDIPEVPLFSK